MTQRVKTFTSPTKEGLETTLNEFAEENHINDVSYTVDCSGRNPVFACMVLYTPKSESDSFVKTNTTE